MSDEPYIAGESAPFDLDDDTKTNKQISQSDRIPASEIHQGDANNPTAILVVDDSQDESIGVKLETFTLFPKLPIELRLKIWKYALPNSRVVEVMLSGDGSQRQGHMLYIFRSTASQEFSTWLLKTCQTSRKVFLESYRQPQPEFRNPKPDNSENCSWRNQLVLYPTRGWIDEDRDIVMLNENSASVFRTFGSPLKFDWVRNLVLPFDKPSTLSQTYLWKFAKTACPNIKSLTLPMSGVDLQNSLADVEATLDLNRNVGMVQGIMIVSPTIRRGMTSNSTGPSPAEHDYANTLAHEAVERFGTVHVSGNLLGVFKMNHFAEPKWDYFHLSVTDLNTSARKRLWEKVKERRMQKSANVMLALFPDSQKGSHFPN